MKFTVLAFSGFVLFDKIESHTKNFQTKSHLVHMVWDERCKAFKSNLTDKTLWLSKSYNFSSFINKRYNCLLWLRFPALNSLLEQFSTWKCIGCVGLLLFDVHNCNLAFPFKNI